uniref:Glycosyltransferase family 92 protein n=1 Tax=Gongylonema pulchrum TaxID=637853 RepID=A0A183DIF7_9BILA
LVLDFKKHFENYFLSKDQSTIVVLPPQYIKSTECFWIMPQLEKVMAQNGSIALFRSHLLSEQECWIMVDLDTMVVDRISAPLRVAE